MIERDAAIPDHPGYFRQMLRDQIGTPVVKVETNQDVSLITRMFIIEQKLQAFLFGDEILRSVTLFFCFIAGQSSQSVGNCWIIIALAAEVRSSVFSDMSPAVSPVRTGIGLVLIGAHYTK